MHFGVVLREGTKKWERDLEMKKQKDSPNENSTENYLNN